MNNCDEWCICAKCEDVGCAENTCKNCFDESNGTEDCEHYLNTDYYEDDFVGDDIPDW